jgi:hypothetical protein
VKKKSSTKLLSLPDWVKPALQGVVFWIGHRRSFYRHHPLTEGALVAEICNLISAHLSDNDRLTCEVQYSKLLPEIPKPKNINESELITEKARADLVVSEGSLDSDSKQPKFFIEVKRYSAGKSEIEMDLRRLAEVRRRYSDARAFLFVISEAKRPDHFVNEKGNSRKGERVIPNSTDHYQVRNTWKAAHAFSNRERAQYACVLEVY